MPSVVVIRTGSRNPRESRGRAEEKPPMPLSIAAEGMRRMNSTNLSPLSMSTPASR